MKTIVLNEPGSLSLAATPPASPPHSNEALVRVRRIGICGTDPHAFAGEQPFFTYPRVLGHELGVEIQDLNVTKDTPPAFLACAYDDRPTMAEYVATLFLTLKKAGVPAELHIYSSGGHGFGMRKGPHPVAEWPSRLQEWLADLQFLRKP